jgi:hypothetical protein
VIILALGPSTCFGQYGVGGGDDIDPANPPANFWTNFGIRYIRWYTWDTTNGITVYQPLVYSAYRNWVATAPKCVDADGMNYTHVYMAQDYSNRADADR